MSGFGGKRLQSSDRKGLFRGMARIGTRIPPIFYLQLGVVGKANPVPTPIHWVWRDGTTLPPRSEVLAPGRRTEPT